MWNPEAHGYVWSTNHAQYVLLNKDGSVNESTLLPRYPRGYFGSTSGPRMGADWSGWNPGPGKPRY